MRRVAFLRGLRCRSTSGHGELVPTTPEPIAYQNCGGSAHFNEAAAGNVIRDYAAFSLEAAPVLKRQGYKRLFLHNPGGQHALGWMPEALDIYRTTKPDPANPTGPPITDPHAPIIAAQRAGVDVQLMHVNQWQLAQQSACPFANDRQLRLAFENFVYHGLREIIFYVGPPDVLPDPYEDGLKALAPFTSLGKEASIAFDVLGWEQRVFRSPWHKARSVRLVERLRLDGHRVYLEPRPDPADKTWLGKVDGTVAAEFVDKQRPAADEAAHKLGEKIRLPDGFDTGDQNAKAWPPDVTRLTYLWRTIPAAEVKAGR